MVGRVPISGSKNAVLPILAACLLTEEECRLKNVPRIEDVSTMMRLLEGMGVQVRWLDPQQLQVNAERLAVMLTEMAHASLGVTATTTVVNEQ